MRASPVSVPVWESVRLKHPGTQIPNTQVFFKICHTFKLAKPGVQRCQQLQGCERRKVKQKLIISDNGCICLNNIIKEQKIFEFSRPPACISPAAPPSPPRPAGVGANVGDNPPPHHLLHQGSGASAVTASLVLLLSALSWSIK